MSSFVGVLVSDQWLQSQFTQVELLSLKTKVSFFFFLLDFNEYRYEICIEMVLLTIVKHLTYFLVGL